MHVAEYKSKRGRLEVKQSLLLKFIGRSLFLMDLLKVSFYVDGQPQMGMALS